MRSRTFVIGLIVFALFITGVYALLATTLNITGTATGTGDFKVEFSNYTVSTPSKATVTLDTNNTTMNINSNLTFPGDTVTINFTIENTGSLPATVNDLTVNENSTADFTIQVVGLNSIEGTTLQVGETTTGSVVITWNTSSTTATPEDVNFDVTINYIQAT